MSREQEKKPDPFTLEEVVSLASETILRDGYHAPTFIAEGSEQNTIIQLAELADTHVGRLRQMFTIGYFLALEHEIGTLQQVFFISEGWMSMSKGQPPQIRASQDPNRKEVLTISGFQMEQAQVSLVTLEMVRNKKGRLIDLKPSLSSREAEAHADAPLLVTFVEGFQAAIKT
jgi:hypothetical protein